MSRSLFKFAFTVCALACTAQAGAAPTPEYICQKMIAEDRAGGQSHSQCLCAYRIADSILDDDLKLLLFDAWENGTNNMEKLGSLPRQNRVAKQLRMMNRAVQKTCN